MKKQPPKKQSRRQIQRRFPPGEFVVSKETCQIMGTVIGWSAVRADLNPKTGQIRTAESWEVLILTKNNTMNRRGWWSMEGLMNLDEWEDWVTTP